MLKIASAARAVSSSSSGPESNGIARRKNSAVKARFSSVGKASNASSNWLVWRLITLSLDLRARRDKPPWARCLTINGAAFTNNIQRVGYLKLARLEGFGNSFKVRDYANRATRRAAEVKLSAPTAGADDRTDDSACGADDVAVPAKVQISTFSNDR
jgi:hypothetical protein